MDGRCGMSASGRTVAMRDLDLSTIFRLACFSLTTANANALSAFYESAFGCRRIATERLSGPNFESLMGVQGGAQVLNRLSGFGERGVELRAIGERAHLLQFAFAQRARDVAAQQLPQGFEFQDFSACLQVSLLSDFSAGYRHFRNRSLTVAALPGVAVSQSEPRP